MDCWWIYQRDTANKKRRNRYHAKRNPADAPEDGAAEQHALPPLASEAGAAEPLLPPSIDYDAVEQHAPAPQAAAAEQRAPGACFDPLD